MVWDTCNIVLHGGSNGFYYTNDIITGTVVLEFKQDRRVEQIYLRVKGISKASWSRPSPTVPYIKIYSQKKRVLDVTVEVFKELQGNTAKAGVISCQFHFVLPADLPPTYKDSIAKVYYQVIMKSTNIYKIKNKNNVYFTVLNHLNINHINEYKIPMVFELHKKFGNSAFTLTFKTYRGFASNQQIPFEATLTNEKKVRVNKISVALIQKIVYNVTSGFYRNEKIICKSDYNNNILNIAQQTCVFSMDIPQIISSTINQSDPMIDISYSLLVKVSFRFHLPLYSDIPVTIASTPVTHGIFYK